MGFNITGIAIDKNYSQDIDSLAQAFGWKLDKVGEVDFETASANWTDEGDCFACFTDSGTLLFVGGEQVDRSLGLEQRRCLSFCLSEMTMVFFFCLTENKQTRRHLILMEGELAVNTGEPLTVDIDPEHPDDGSEMIWHHIGDVLGKSFWDIDLDTSATHFKLTRV